MSLKKQLTLALWLVSFGLNAQIVNVRKVNSIYDEQNPVLSPDGRILYFTRSRHPENVGGERDLGDIWYSNLMPDGSFSEPVNARALNNSNWNGVLGFIGGSDVIYLINHYSKEGDLVKTQGIARSIKTTSGWSLPENINVPYFKNTSQWHGGSILSDASVLVMSLETFGTNGGEDLYVSFNKGNSTWTEPKNLGTTINTKYQEFTPFLTDDGKTLYFSSNGHQSRGGTDIFYSQRLDDTWQNWSKPIAFDLLNSDGKELGFHLYGPIHLYTSTVNSDGYGDVKLYIPKEAQDSIANLVQEVVPLADKTAFKEIVPVLDGRFLTLYGNITDKSTGKPIDARISIKTLSDSLVANVKALSGSYAFKLEAIGQYLIRVEAPKYMSYQANLDLNSDQIKSLEKSVALDPIKVGATVNLKNVLFKQSKAEFVETSYAELNLVVEFMKENPSVKIRLEGHTDNRGVAKYNVQLSKDRVDAVKKYLVKKGIASKRITGKGYGGSRPIADNENPETRILNRRVEFTIIKD